MKMRALASLLLLLVFAGHTYGLSCHICSDLDFGGELGDTNHDCFTVVATTGTLCAGAVGTEYCTSTFMIRDGVVFSAVRACASTGATTTTVPGSQCTTSYDTSVAHLHTGSTTCVYTCTGDNCNNNAAASFDMCTTDCNQPDAQGECNYINGSCNCDSGYTGADCSTPPAATTLRSCVQCSSETDSTCATATASTPCEEITAPNVPQLEYCSTTVSKIFDQADGVVKTVTVRGCTATFVATDQCSFSVVSGDTPINGVGYREFSCYSTCNTDGCNTNTANGVIGTDESVPLMCVQCSDTSRSTTCDSMTTRTPCASGSTHCKATVTYLISEKVDRSYTGVFSDDVAYERRSVVRECATAAVTAECTDTTVTGLDGVKKVTCTETCQEDGCNVGWPARPKCIQCSSDGSLASKLVLTQSEYDDGYDECLENPPIATDCGLPYQGYCVIIDVGIEKDKTSSVLGYPRRITRTCSHVDILTRCLPETVRKTTIENCNRTCDTDGCNAGSGSSMPIQTLMAVAIPAVIGMLAEIYL